MDLSDLCGKTVLITGATGLIGSNIIHYILTYNNSVKNKIKVIGLVRNIKKAQEMFSYDPNLNFIQNDICQKISVDETVDFIIHSASQTSSKGFVNNPVETINISFLGTTNILNFAREKKVKSVVFLSTMEVYGTPTSDEKIDETHACNLDTMNVRSCYPESKRLCENLCMSYYSEYSVPVKVIRLTQTFGPGVDYNDGRVFAEFARCAIENRDIVLHTKGETKRNYLYTEDAVEAILTVLSKGENGSAYNAANENTYCSIYEMAELVANKIAGGRINVLIQEEDISSFGYASILKMNLNTTKLRNLGWTPKTGLEDAYRYLINDWKMKKY